MGNRVRYQLFFMLFCSALFLFAGHGFAASLGKIEVASHLGEPFFAEVPLKLEANELPSKVFVEIAAPADYKIFEVYRDPVVKAIRADVASDARGVRVELSSRSQIRSPFFNLVLKVRYGRVSHFKKFPVFLDVAKTVQQAAKKAPQPAVAAVAQPASAVRSSLTESAGQTVAPSDVQPAASKQNKIKYYEGWARTDRYGPIVKGDSLSIIAERLRVDYRYTRNQIMLALFEKNRADFEQGNMNLMKAGSFLKVPTAAEVEKHSKLEATRVLAEHENAWKKLTRQPRYAAVAEAQRSRYSKRISIGEHADGVAAAPAATAVAASASLADQQQSAAKQSAEQAATSSAAPASEAVQRANTAEKSASVPASAVSSEAPQAAQTSAEQAAADQALQEQTSQTLIRLQEQNDVLKQQLIGTQKSIEDLSRKLAQNQAASDQKAHIKKLEVMIAGLQTELKKMQQQTPASAPVAGMNWMLWLLALVVVLLLGIIAKLMRREPAHPAEPTESKSEPAAGSPDADVEPSIDQDVVEDDSLTSVIESEVAGIETGETPATETKETATIDSLPAFTDELGDTDTAELEPFDADSQSEPDPDIDYLSEADVYIRYGMEDEALKQLDMALRLQPDNVEAHIKKAELLLGKSDREGLDATIAAATMTLTAVDLGRFKSFVQGLGEEVDGLDTAALEEPRDEEEGDRSETLALEPSAADDLDFDLEGLDGIVDEVAAGEITGELELPEIDQASVSDDAVEFEQAHDPESEDMPWLHDEMFDAVAEEGAPLQLSDSVGELSLESAVDTGSESVSDSMALTEPESLTVPEPAPDSETMPQADMASAPETETQSEEATDFNVIGGATQELDSLLSEFSGEDDGGTGDGDAELGATRRLDQLLSEFDDEDEAFDAASDVDALDDSLFDAVGSSVSAGAANESDTDIDHGATQELDHLLSEFANEDDGLLEIDTDFDSLVDGDSEGAGDSAGATQVLGRLLDEFTDESSDDEEGSHKK